VEIVECYLYLISQLLLQHNNVYIEINLFIIASLQNCKAPLRAPRIERLALFIGFDSHYPLTMKIRFTAPEWFKRKRKERNERLLEDTHSKTYQQNVDWGEEISYILPSIAKIIPAFVVLMVGLALVGPTYVYQRKTRIVLIKLPLRQYHTQSLTNPTLDVVSRLDGKEN